MPDITQQLQQTYSENPLLDFLSSILYGALGPALPPVAEQDRSRRVGYMPNPNVSGEQQIALEGFQTKGSNTGKVVKHMVKDYASNLVPSAAQALLSLVSQYAKVPVGSGNSVGMSLDPSGQPGFGFNTQGGNQFSITPTIQDYTKGAMFRYTGQW